MSDQETPQPEDDENGQKTARQPERGGRERSKGRQPPNVKRGGNQQSLNMDELRELVELISGYGFTDFELENKDIRVRLRRDLSSQFPAAEPGTEKAESGAEPQTASQSANPATTSSGIPTQSIAPVSSTADVQEALAEDENLHLITSPIVGTFYRYPSPNAEPFVRLGSQVGPDTIVCIIEAMKLMNEILAEASGVVAKIYVENGQPVEYGQPLFGIKK